MIFWHARSDKLLTLKILSIQFFKIVSPSRACVPLEDFLQAQFRDSLIRFYL